MTTLYAKTCVICTRRPPEWSLCCAGCTQRMRHNLLALVDEYALLDARPGASTGQRVSGTRTAPLPLRLDVLNLVGPGSATVTDPHADQTGDLPTLVWLEQWVDDWRDVRGQGEHRPDPIITGLVSWLLRRLDWAADEHPAIDEFARELGKQLGALRAANRTDEPKPERQEVGLCPQLLDHGQVCGTTLYRYPRLSNIVCDGCGGEWRQGPQWLWLAKLIRGEESA